MRNATAPRRMRFSFETRCAIVHRIQQGASPAEAAFRYGASRATGYRLWRSFQRHGYAGLHDQPPIARHCPHRLDAAAEQQILELRAHTGWGPRSLAAALGRSHSTVYRVLRRHHKNRHQRQPRPPANRYEYPTVGALVHLDTKKLGRFWQIGKRVHRDPSIRSRSAGWQNAHVAVDDHSRLVICELNPAEDAASCTRFLELVIEHYAERGITIERVMTDNGNGYRSHAFRDILAQHQIRHLRTKPYTPRTNGKAEAFIRILQREWAYGYAYHSSAHRARALPGYIRWYNKRRPHGSLNGQPPLTRVSQGAGLYS